MGDPNRPRTPCILLIRKWGLVTILRTGEPTGGFSRILPRFSWASFAFSTFHFPYSNETKLGHCLSQTVSESWSHLADGFFCQRLFFAKLLFRHICSSRFFVFIFSSTSNQIEDQYYAGQNLFEYKPIWIHGMSWMRCRFQRRFCSANIKPTSPTCVGYQKIYKKVCAGRLTMKRINSFFFSSAELADRRNVIQLHLTSPAY